MTILEHEPNPLEKAYKILATDIDIQVLKHAKQGWFNSPMANELSEERKSRFFSHSEGTYNG